MAHAIERELIKASNYKARTKFDDRQDYLSSILNAVMKMTDSDFDDLSDEAAAWANSAVEAHNSKEEIPDFDEVEVPDDDAEDDGDADDDEDQDSADSDEGDSEDDEDGSEDDTTDSADSDDDADADSDEDADDEDTETEDPEDEDEDDEPPVVKKKPAKAKAPKKAAPPPPAKKPVKAKPAKRAASDDDVVLDKWGCMEGSKNSQALALFEKGATAKEVKEELGGTYYNILKRCVENGHTIEKAGALIKLIHKDEKRAAKPAKAAPKKGKK